MAWDAKSVRESRNGTSLLRLFKSKKNLAIGDAFPKLDFSSPSRPVAPTDPPTAMDHEDTNLTSMSEEHFSPPPGAPLTVHVTIQCTDPVIRSRYSRSYTSSHTFEPTNRICNGLLRRIDHCAKELLTRKDSTALDQYKDGTHERKCMRFEITFRIVRRGVGEWAERRFRSYQKQPLTVGLTKDIQLATHRIVGLFLRRHDKNFQWLDGSIVDHSPEAPETALPSSDARLSLLCVPRSRFLESSQSFEFVPGYTIQLSFRSRNPMRATQVVKSTIKVDSSQPAPLSLLMSEEIQWKGLQAINQGLEERKRELYTHIGICHATNCSHSEDDALQIELSISNNLGIRHHVYRVIKSNFALFRDPEAKDCNEFLHSIKKSLVEASEHSDAEMNKLDDFEFNVVELRGRNWSVRSPLRFTQGPAASYGRRTIQAALDRIQTGIGDVLRGNNVAVHISARKRGHLVLDKAIIAREKQGRPAEMFSSVEEQRNAFVSRLKMRIERDMEMVFKDTCSIDDIPEDTDEVLEQRSPGPEAGYLETRIDSIRSLSPTISRQRTTYGNDSPQASPTKPAVQRAFSLGGRSVSSAASIISARNLDEFRSMDMMSESGSRRSSMSVQDQPLGERLFRDTPSPSPSPSAPIKPQRRFSLLPRNYSSQSTRVSSASTLICETPSVLEESPEIHTARESSQEIQIIKAEASDTDKVPEIDGLPDISKVNSMTLNDVANTNTREPAGMVPGHGLGILESDLSPSVLSHAEVIAQEGAADFQALEEQQQGGNKPQEKCDNADDAQQRLATDVVGGSEEMDYNQHQHTIMDAFQDAQEYATAGLSLHAMSLAAAVAVAAKGGGGGDPLKSPGIDEYSTAPSTPALSLGGDSSPRPSLLATPGSYLPVSGTKGEEEDRIFEPESDDAEEADIVEPATDASGNLEHQESTDTPSDFGDEFGLGDSIEQPATEQFVAEPEIPMQQQQQQEEERNDLAAVDKNEISGPDTELPVSDTASDVTEGGELLQDQPATVPSDGDTEPMAAEPTGGDITRSSGGDPIKPPNDTNAVAKDEENENQQVNQQLFSDDDDDRPQILGAENVAAGPDLGDLNPPDMLGGEVRGDPAPVSDSPDDDSDANLDSDNAQDGTEGLGLPPANVGLDSDANPFVVLVDEVAEADNGPEVRLMPPAGAGLDANANPFVLLVDEVGDDGGPESTPDPDGNEDEVAHGAEGQIDSATGIESMDIDDLEGPGWTKVGTEGNVPEEDEASGLVEPGPSTVELDPEGAEHVPEEVHGSGTTPERKQQPFIAPTGSAVENLEAEILAAAVINNLIAGGEEMFKVDPGKDVLAEPAETEWKLDTSPEPESESECEPVAPEEEDDQPRQTNIDAASQQTNQSILNQHVPAAVPEEEEKEAETLAASDSVTAAAADPDTFPDDIGHSEVAQLQARLLLGEDYDLSSPAGPELNSTAAASQEDDDGHGEGDGRDANVDQTEPTLPAVIVGVLDPNIGTDPEASVVFQVIADGDGEDQLQGQKEQQQERVSSRRASELDEDICGHEYSTGSHRVGYAAVCLTGPPESDEGLSEAAPDATAGTEAIDEDEALAESDRLKQPPIDTDTQDSITDLGGGQVDQVPPVVVEVIKQVLIGQVSEVAEPDGPAARRIDEAPTAPKAATETGHLDATDLSHPESEGLESTPAMIAIITDDEMPLDKEAESRDTLQRFPEMLQSPLAAAVVDSTEQIHTGELKSEDLRSDNNEERIDIEAELEKLEREIEMEENYPPDDEQVIHAELAQLMREMEIKAPNPEMSEPAAPTVVVVLGQEEGPEREEEKLPAELSDILGLVQSGPEDATSKTEAQTVADDPLPRVVAVPDIPNEIPFGICSYDPFAFDSPSASAGPEEAKDISVKDFDAPVSVPSSHLAGASAGDALHVASEEGSETPRPKFSTYLADTAARIFPKPKFSVDGGSSSASSSSKDPVAADLGYDTVGISARGSVDTIRPSFDDEDSEEEPEHRPQSRPQTAGYLGLGDANRRFKVLGVFGGSNGDILAGKPDSSRRYSLPLHYLLDGQQQRQQQQSYYYTQEDQDGAASASASGAAAATWKGKGKAAKEGSKNKSPKRTATWAKLMGLEAATLGKEGEQEEKKHTHKHRKTKPEPEQESKEKEEMKGSNYSTLTEESSAEQAFYYEGPTPVVPRMMMLLAGVVAVGKIIKGPGNH